MRGIQVVLHDGRRRAGPAGSTRWCSTTASRWPLRHERSRRQRRRLAYPPGQEEKEKRTSATTGYVPTRSASSAASARRPAPATTGTICPTAPPIPDPGVEKIIEETSKSSASPAAPLRQEILERALYPMITRAPRSWKKAWPAALDIDVIWFNGTAGRSIATARCVGRQWGGTQDHPRRLLKYRDASGDPF